VFRKHKPQLTSENAVVATATTIDVKFGRAVFERNVGGNTQTSGKRTMLLRIEADGALPYETELVLKGGDPPVPIQRGGRFEVFVDPDDPKHVEVVPDQTFTLPGGGTWKPEPNLGIGRAASDAAIARAQELAEQAQRARESNGEQPADD
jgi:hypothetical protein